MAKKLRKAQARQRARIKDYLETVERAERQKTSSGASYRKPGSMKK